MIHITIPILYLTRSLMPSRLCYEYFRRRVVIYSNKKKVLPQTGFDPVASQLKLTIYRSDNNVKCLINGI